MHNCENVILMNVCAIEDNKNNILIIDKIKGAYRGITLPGGHIEKYEVFNNSVIREIKEETGLDIKNPILCGVYHWYIDDTHNIIFVYKTKEYTGNLKSSEEGKVYWINKVNLKNMKLAAGTEYILAMIDNNKFNECVINVCDEGYNASLY